MNNTSRLPKTFRAIGRLSRLGRFLRDRPAGIIPARRNAFKNGMATEGGMGEVYLAQDMRLGRKVALKLLSTYLSSDGERLHRFEQEARAASTLSHANVCVVHEVGEAKDGRHYIVMEYVEGMTLREHLNGTRMKMSEVLDTAGQVGSALTKAQNGGGG